MTAGEVAEMGAASMKRYTQDFCAFTFTCSLSLSHFGQRVDRSLGRRSGENGRGASLKTYENSTFTFCSIFTFLFSFPLFEHRVDNHERAPSLKNKTFTVLLSHLVVIFVKRKTEIGSNNPGKYNSFILSFSHIHGRRWETSEDRSNILERVHLKAFQ